MAWSYGFFNSVDGDRTYNAQQMSEIFDGLITEGVYEAVGNKLAVQPNDGMTIQINTGRGFVGKHWVKNDSIYTHTLEPSDVLLNRYCAVCIRADDTDSVRNAVPYFKYSEFATNPVKPTMVRTEKITERCLAYIYIKAKAKAITAADIEDTRGDTNLCGWVTGLIDQVDTTTLWEQYKAEWNTFMDANEAEIEAVTEAKNAANTAASNATTQANYAKEQGDEAKTQASNAQTQAAAAETAATNAQTQAKNAQAQATAADAAADRAIRAAENAEVTDIGSVNTRIDNLQIGVVNRLTKTHTPTVFNCGRYGTNIVLNTIYGAAENLSEKSGIFSFDCEIQNFVAAEDTSRIALVATDSSVYYSMGSVTITDNGMVHFKRAVTLPVFTNPENFRIYARADYCNVGMIATISNLKLEIGEYETDWLPAPEDYIDRVKRSTGTFNGTAWTQQADGTYRQTIVVNGVTSLNDILVSPASEYKDVYAAMACEAVSQGTNNVTFKCHKPQDVAAKVDVMIFNI